MQSTPNGPKPIVSVKDSKKFCKDTCVLCDDGIKWCKDTSNEWAKCVIGLRNTNALPVEQKHPSSSYFQKLKYLAA